MIINKQQMDEINSVQYDMFRAYHAVCEQLNLKYYLVHGSLLGALRYHGFFPMDDDIDVAMLRKDYDVFMREGQKFLGNKYFVQSHLSEKEYPLVFGKVRASGTAFIQPVLKNCHINKGIYIDVFPIDNLPKSKWQRYFLKLKVKIYTRRVNSKLYTGLKLSIKSRLVRLFLKILMPSWESTRDKLCNLYSKIQYTGEIIVRGGKIMEEGINSDFFGTPVRIQFEQIESFAPEKTDEYLKLIYGNYMKYEPMRKDMISDNEVMISADIIDIHKSYREYET